MSYAEYNAAKARMPSKPAIVQRDSRSEWTANLQLRAVRK